MKTRAERWRSCGWLRELALQWHAARGRGGPFQRHFSRDWEELLEECGQTSAESRAEALREARELSQQQFIQLKTDRYRTYQIERVVVPFESEAELRIIFELPPEPGGVAFDAAGVKWVPQLGFLVGSRISVIPQDLLKLNEFFLKQEREAVAKDIVPIKGRSLQIFGDEKRLDSLLATSLFRADRLRLESLLCEQVGEPLGWRRGPVAASNKALLVIENAATWHSYARWNEAAGEFSAVVYGRGFQCSDSVQYLRDIFRELGGPSEVLYFGDLDAPGLQIPQQASVYAKGHGLPAFQPHLPSYQLLLRHAAEASVWEGELATRADCDWLGPLAEISWEVLMSGRRLPQEFVGWDEIVRNPPVIRRTEGDQVLR